MGLSLVPSSVERFFKSIDLLRAFFDLSFCEVSTEGGMRSELDATV